MSTIWTKERIALLKKLHAEGMRASAIAGELGGGITKNAVLGKVHRLGLAAPTGRQGPRSPRTVEPPKPALPVKEPPVVRITPKIARPKPKPAPAPEPVTGPLPLLDLRSFQCRFPVQDSPLLFCAQPTVSEKSSWCRDCAERVWVRRPVSIRRAA